MQDDTEEVEKQRFVVHAVRADDVVIPLLKLRQLLRLRPVQLPDDYRSELASQCDCRIPGGGREVESDVVVQQRQDVSNVGQCDVPAEHGGRKAGEACAAAKLEH